MNKNEEFKPCRVSNKERFEVSKKKSRKYETHIQEFGDFGVINTDYSSKSFDVLSKAIEFGDKYLETHKLRSEYETYLVCFSIFEPGAPNDDIPIYEKSFVVQPYPTEY